MASAKKYRYTEAIIVAVSGAISIYLNFQGYRCLSDIARLDSSVVGPKLEKIERNCSIITNSYAYSIYGVIAGIVLVVIGFMKKKGNVS